VWRSVDQDGEVVDAYLQAKRDGVIAWVRWWDWFILDSRS
jgi:hypothetical protein